MFCRGKNIFFWYQRFFSWSYLRYQLFMFNLEYAQIIKILEPNSSTYCFITSINWSLYSLLIKLLAVVTLWHLLLKIMMNLVEEVPRFWLVIFLILSTLNVSLINPNSFIVKTYLGKWTWSVPKSRQYTMQHLPYVMLLILFDVISKRCLLLPWLSQLFRRSCDW